MSKVFPFPSNFPPTLDDVYIYGVPVASRPGEFRLSCPLCGKPDGKLYANVYIRKWYCFRHGEGGSLADVSPASLDLPSLFSRTSHSVNVKFTLRTWNEMPDVLQYLIQKRRMSKERVFQYGLCPALVTRNNFKAVAVPILTPSGITDHFYFRVIDSSEVKHLSFFPKSELLYCHMTSVTAPRIYIMEGIFDVLCSGLHAVAIFGKFLSADQLHQLAKFAAREVVVALDGAAPRENKVELALQVKTALPCVRVGFLEIPEGYDPGDLGPDIRRCNINWLGG